MKRFGFLKKICTGEKACVHIFNCDKVVQHHNIHAWPPTPARRVTAALLEPKIPPSRHIFVLQLK